MDRRGAKPTPVISASDFYRRSPEKFQQLSRLPTPRHIALSGRPTNSVAKTLDHAKVV
jgi:hypothetical protein